MFENLIHFFKNLGKKEKGKSKESSDTAKERLHLVLMQDRANVSADFLELMKQEIIEVIKKYIDVDEKAIDVRLTNKSNEDGTVGAPALYANIPIGTIKNEARRINNLEEKNKKEISEPSEINQEKIEQNESESSETKQEEKPEDKKEAINETENKQQNPSQEGALEESKIEESKAEEPLNENGALTEESEDNKKEQTEIEREDQAEVEEKQETTQELQEEIKKEEQTSNA